MHLAQIRIHSPFVFNENWTQTFDIWVPFTLGKALFSGLKKKNLKRPRRFLGHQKFLAQTTYWWAKCKWIRNILSKLPLLRSNRSSIATLSVHVCVYSVAQLCLSLCDPMDCSPSRRLCLWNFPGKNTGVGSHSFSRGSSWPRNPIWVSYIGRQILSHCTTKRPTEDIL